MFLTINNIKKSFGSGDSRIEVLKGINLSMEQGEFCVLLGPSGSGKSTLLNIIGGIDAADEGDICIEGERTVDGCVGIAVDEGSDALHGGQIEEVDGLPPEALGLHFPDV